MPDNELFGGGYINFRKVITVAPEDIEIKFNEPKVKIQDFFIKNILNRFSSYYARQGQPDFDLDKEVSRLIEDFEE